MSLPHHSCAGPGCRCRGLSAEPLALPVLGVAHLPGLKGPMRPDVFCACSLFHEEGRILQVLASHLPGPSRLQLRVWFSVVGRHWEASSYPWLSSTRREDSHRGPPHGTRHKPCWLHPSFSGPRTEETADTRSLVHSFIPHVLMDHFLCVRHGPRC